MDAYEATRIVFSRIQSLDPENAPKIMGLLLIQDHGEKEMIRLAFGPGTLVHSVVLKARKDLGLLPPSNPTTPSSSASPSPFLLARQNSASRMFGGLPSPSSWAPSPVFSRSNINGVVDDIQNPEEFINPNLPFMASCPSSTSSPPPFYGGDLIDDFQFQDQPSFLSDPAANLSSPNSIHSLPIGPKNGSDLYYSDISTECRSPSANGEGMFFPYGGMNWGASGHHRRSCSVADLCLSSEAGSGFGWKPCLYFARGYCKNGSSCRFMHGLPEDSSAAAMAGSKIDAVVEQQCHELLLRSKSQRLSSASQLMASAASFPYAAASSLPKCMTFLQQQQSESQRMAVAAALMLGSDDPHKYAGRARIERNDFAGMVNPGSRQIYLTFPADSSFREEDVSNYFSIYGPVQDVRIPYQQKRMFGFVTFVYPETVKLILAKGNPHFVCDARVLVKPYKEKGKVPDKKQQQQAERGDFSGCSTPTGMDSRDPFDLQQLGARMLYNNSQEVMLRRKLEEQQQAADLQQAIELQGRRFMGLQLLDLKTRNLSSSALSVGSLSSPHSINTPTDGRIGSPEKLVPPEDKCPGPGAATNGLFNQAGGTTAASAGAGAEQQKQQRQQQINSHGFVQQAAVSAAGADKEESAGEGNPNEDCDFQESAEHNLPDSPFASPTESPFLGDLPHFSLVSEADITASSPSLNNNNSGSGNTTSNNHLNIASSLLPATSTLDMASFKSCFFQMPRFSSGPVGM